MYTNIENRIQEFSALKTPKYVRDNDADTYTNEYRAHLQITIGWSHTGYFFVSTGTAPSVHEALSVLNAICAVTSLKTMLDYINQLDK